MIQQLLAAGLGNTVDQVLGRFFEDKDKAAEAAHELRLGMLEHEVAAQQVARDVVVSEAQSHHWITSSWRPVTMLVFVAIVANNFILAPYIDLFFDAGLQLDVPPPMWDLIKIGLGGYVIGRSAEKVADRVKQ